MQGTAGAQLPDSLRRDTTRVRDSIPRLDTLAGAPVRDTAALVQPADSIKAPFGRMPLPALLDLAPPYHWDRQQLAASGALTLADLLERVPGVSVFRAGFIAAPLTAAYLGDPSRVRIFYDGVELDALDPRTGGLLDLGEVQLFSLGAVSIERGADELRVYLRSWEVDNTTAYTRTDVVTGDLSTNLYRGFYGRRFSNGAGFQVAGQQYGTTSDAAGGGDQLSLLARLGVARRGWSVDGFVVRASRTRDAQTGAFTAIPPLKDTRTDAYIRAGLGRADSGAWAQITAASLRFQERTPHSTGDGSVGVDTVDSTTSHAQYVAAAGFTRGPLRLSGGARLVRLPHSSHGSLTGRAAFDRSRLALALYAEERGSDSSSVEEATVRVRPLDVVGLSGTVSRRHGGRDPVLAAAGIDGELGSVTASRLEAGVRLGGGLWLTGGLLHRSATTIPPLTVLSPGAPAIREEPDDGLLAQVRGRLWKDLGADAEVVRWKNGGFYRPQLQSRAEVHVNTRWLSRFPSGNFGFLGSIAHLHQSEALFPEAPDENGQPTAAVNTGGNFFESRVEIRILSGVLFWNFRRTLDFSPPEIVPGFEVPRQLSFYGIRWEFWN